MRKLVFLKYRVSQFIKALNARVHREEIEEISLVLTPAEISLFLSMSVVDQRHSLDVYYTSLQVRTDFPSVNHLLCSKAALLHDLGKSRFSLSILDRILATLPMKIIQMIFFWKYEHIRDYKYLHPRYSSEMVLDAQIRDWVLYHYLPVCEQDAPELKVLKISDSMN